MTHKVIEFPKSKVVREVPEEIHLERQAKADMKQADTIVDEVAGLMITELDNYYVDVTNKQFAKDIILVVDALKAAVYRSYGIDHHLHPFIDDNVKLIEGDIDSLSKEEIKEKIEKIMLELSEAKDKIDSDEEE
jgi:hypothetical protein